MSTNFPTDYCVTPVSQGGGGGGSFSYSVGNGYTISKIECWVADHRMIGIKAYFSNSPDGYSDSDVSHMAGQTSGSYSSFQFDVGELLTSLTIYKAEYSSNDFCGGLTFTTSAGRSFEATSSNKKSPVEMDVGYGAAVGIFGDSGDAIDRLGFYMILPAFSIALSDVSYETSPAAPSYVGVKTLDYTCPANATEAQTYTYTAESTETTTSSWSTLSSVESSTSVTATISASIYEVVEVEGSATAEWTEYSETSNSWSYEHSETDTLEVVTTVQPGYNVVVTIYYYTGNYTLPYTALATLRLNNNNVFNYYLSGQCTGGSTTGYTTSETVTQITTA